MQICHRQDLPDTSQSGEITAYESDALEYVGGYSLKCAVSKFGRSSVIDILSSDHRKNGLIALLEKRSGSLFCPSEEFSSFLQQLYVILSVEFHKNPRKIDTISLTESIINGHQFTSFLERTDWAASECDEKLTREVLEYIVGRLISLLARGFAKKLFQRIRGKCLLSHGLRGNLKRQVKH